jgi:FkbM family methyltransferase
MTDSLMEFIERNVPPGGLALDIGANCGFYTTLFAARFDRVVAFEPNPDSLAQLGDATANMANVVIIPAALSNKPGRTSFHLDRRDGMAGVASSIYDLGIPSEIIEVNVTTIDQACAEQGRPPSFMKIDVEGAEPFVIDGGWDTIIRYRPVMVFEFWESWWDKGFSELFAKLSPLYDLTRLQDGSEATAYYTQPRLEVADICAVPKAH